MSPPTRVTLIGMPETSAAAAPTPMVPHTRVPNLVADFVLPCLSGAESSCLMYVVRRTYGFASADGARKMRDRISLSQFEHGIQSGAYVLDIGTGLRRQSIVSALRSLEEKGLLLVARHCSRCLWEGDLDTTSTEQHCPRCRRTLDKWYSLVELTPRRLVAFMNSNDPRRRTWNWDTQVKRLRVSETATDTPVTARADAKSLSDYADLFWYPKLVDQIIAELVHAKRGTKLNNAQVMTHVYAPVLAMQERASRNPGVVKKALTETISRGVVRQVKESAGKSGKTNRRVNYSWHRYAQAIVDRALAAQPLGPAMSAQKADPKRIAAEAERGARDLLERAAQLNMDAHHEAARAVLSELLGMADALAPLCGGSTQRADAHLRAAFKKGLSDMLGAPRAVSVADHYPEWSWPTDMPQSA